MKKKMATVVPYVFESIWRERNCRVFEGYETSLQCLKENFMKTLSCWDKRSFACWLLMLLSLWIAHM